MEHKVTKDMTIMQAAAEAGIELEGPCGGKGTCGKCRVKIIDKGKEERVLACRTKIEADMTVEIPNAEVSLYRKSDLSRGESVINIEPGIKKVYHEIETPSLSDQASDADRLLRALNSEDTILDISVLRSLTQILHQQKFRVTTVLADNNVIAVEPGNTTARIFGLAVDIGTTTVVGSLVNLINGETLATASATNAQNIFGADVISRIEHVMQNPKGLEQLNRRVIDVINRIIKKVTKEAKVQEQEIYRAAVVGNTTMSHLFLCLDPTYLASSPFIPVNNNMVQAQARDLELNILPSAQVYILPNIAGYVGADTVGVILATEIDHGTGVRVAVDIGTNGEIVLAHDGKLLTCSTAAGPAFEGAQIQFGMRAANGAIEKVKIEDDVKLGIIGNVPAIGICGSGLLDAVSELARVGVIDQTGRLKSEDQADGLPDCLRQRLGKNENGSYFVLAKGEQAENGPVLITQKDVRELQLAKGAVHAGIEILLTEENLNVEDIDQVLLAGAFGNYIDKKSALTIGLLPKVDPERVLSVGNAAGNGAKLALLSATVRKRAVKVAKQVKHIELSTRLDFQERFLDALGFDI
jgi:Uncharacterized metal-binding protein